MYGQLANSQSSNDTQAEQFYATLIKAVDNGNRHQVAGLFRYPMQVRVLGLDSRLVAVRDAAAMVGMYPLFFGPRFRCAIREDRPVVSNGVLLIANGRLIAQRAADAFKITRLTVALEAPTRPKVPQPVFFPSHKRERQLGGRLAYDQKDNYVVSALAGERLEVRLERFPGRALAVRVYEEQTGQIVNGAAAEYARVWKAQLPRDGQYRVEVERRLHLCEPDVTYLVTLGLR